MGVEILVPLGFFAMLVAIAWLKGRERRDMQDTLRSAIEKGQALPPEFVDALSKNNIKAVPTAARDLRIGTILLAVSIGIALMGYMIGLEDYDAFYPISGIAAIPGMIGLAFIILSFFNKNKG